MAAHHRTTLDTQRTERGIEYRMGSILVGVASFHTLSLYDLHYHDDVPKGRWPLMVSGTEAAGYTMLAIASDMRNGAPPDSKENWQDALGGE